MDTDKYPREHHNLCRHLVERSSGNLVDISPYYLLRNERRSFDNEGDKLFKYMITRCSRSIRRLRIIVCYSVTNAVLMKVASKLPLLEELELSFTDHFRKTTLEAIGRSCPNLKSFKLNNVNLSREDNALAVATTMHGLRHLHLVRNRLTDNILTKILDGCPQLESIDLRGCQERLQLEQGSDLEKPSLGFFSRLNMKIMYKKLEKYLGVHAHNAGNASIIGTTSTCSSTRETQTSVRSIQ